MARKRKAPQRMDETKRKCLTWNMTDMNAGVTVVNDNDPSLQKEQEEAEISQRSGGNIKPSPSKEDIKTEKDRVQKLIDECDYYITIKKKFSLKENEWFAKLGVLSLKCEDRNKIEWLQSDILNQCSEFYLYVNKKTGKHLLYFEGEVNDENSSPSKEVRPIAYFHVTSDTITSCFDGLQSKAFHLVLGNMDWETQTISFAVNITEVAVTKLQFSSEGCKMRKSSSAIQQIMKHVHGYSVQEYGTSPPRMRHNIEELFAVIKEHHAAEELSVKVNVQHDGLRPTLRPYQKRAVSWMLHQEGFGQKKIFEEKLHILYEEHTTLDGQLLYYNRHGGILVRDKPLAVAMPPGGILADEMGLGKTVEVLACMLIHTRTDLPPVQPLPVIKEQITTEEETTKKTNGKGRRKSSVSKQEVQERTASETKVKVTDTSEQSAQNSSLIHDHDYASHRGSSEESKTGFASEAGNEDKDHSYNAKNSEPVSPSPTEAYEDSTTDEKSVAFSDEINTSDRTLNSSVLSDCPTSGSVSNTSTSCGTPNLNSAPCSISETNQVSDDEMFAENNGNSDDKKSIRTKSKNGGKKKGKSNEKKNKRCPSEEVKSEEETKEEDEGQYSPPVIRKEFFECICGQKDLVYGQATEFTGFLEFEKKLSTRRTRKKKGKNLQEVQCERCGLYQHAGCVGYDLQDPFRGPYKCPHCHVASTPIPSGATLIISPISICHQWVEEIRKHIHASSIKVFVYQGVQKQGFVQPQTLANHDIVITTYETLRKEIDYVDLPHSNSDTGRRLRHPKRFMAIPSPIIAVEWWRICLDEAQMVECTTTKTAEMALRLTGVNRWCVTGTPIQRSKDDLYGLLLFLGVEPYWVQYWWNTLLYRPYCHGVKEPLYNAVSKVLWRTAKTDVLDQICLPTQTEDIHWLTFSPVEEHFYRRQYQACANDAAKRLSKWRDREVKLSSLNRDTLHQLLFPLTRLRQACCHPQAVRGEFLPINKSTMTMEELLASLTKKAKLECEEEHRQVVASMNGLSGLHIIRNEYPEAVEMYREVLRSVELHKDKFRTDELQLLHTLHNLSEVLALKPEGVAPTLRDDQLTTQAADIRTRYLQRAAGFATTAQDAWAPVRQSVQELQLEFDDGMDWWIEILRYAAKYGMDDIVIQKVKDDLEENTEEGVQSMSHKFRDLRGLQYLLATQLDQLQTSHDTLVGTVHRLSGKPSVDLINRTVVCCLRPADPDKIARDCPFCKADKVFKDYEAKLFLFSGKGVFGENADGKGYQVGTKRQGTRADSENEKALKSIVSFAKTYGGSREAVEHAAIHFRLFEALKKEFKCIRQVWMMLYEQVQAYDELDMSVMRLRERLPDEPESDSQQIYIIEPAEFETQRLKLISDRIVHQNELRKKLGQLLYLKNLAKAQGKMENGRNPELCPICQKELGTKWSVLTCGHCYCLECVRLMIDKYSFGGLHRRMKCAVCRQLAYISDISYVCTKASKMEGEEDDLRVVGDHSTKVEGVVKCLLRIQKDDPKAKSLVFSTWWDVLNILEKALQDNGITYRALGASNKFQSNLSAFRHGDEARVLLMPLHSGANGLNLIEATHVLLVEPILNPSQELQAIGRVHRIGQTKPTFVHRFLVRGTIEQRMHYLLETVQAPVNSHNSEETNMTIGDLTALFQEIQQATDDDNTEEDEPVQTEVTTTVSASSPEPAGEHTLGSLLSRGTLDAQPSTSHKSSASSPESAGDHTLDSLLSRGTLDPQPSTSHSCNVSASSEPLPYTIRNGGGEGDIKEFKRPNIEPVASAREPRLTHNISYTNIPSHGANISSNTGSDDKSCPISMETTTIVNTDAQNQGTDSQMETIDSVAVTDGTTDAQVVLPPGGPDIASNTVSTRDVADSEFLNGLD